ncbi:MAG: hypothetical protein WCJ58_02645 [bacterium]
MKKYFKVIKIGNSIFSLLPSNLIKQLQIKPGDNVFYELIPGKRQVMMNFASEPGEAKLKNSNQPNNSALDDLAGSLTQ